MGVLDRFERGVERAVNSAFAKAFRSEVQPVEIASALRREADTNAAIVSRGRTIAPNSFVVELGPGDHERLAEWADALSDELATTVREHAAQQRYAFVGPVEVSFEQADDLDTGVFRVRSATVRSTAPPRRPPSAPPAGAPTAPPAQPAAPSPPAGSGAVAVLDVDGRPHEVRRAVTVIGRATDADVVLDDPGASRRHAEIHVVDGRLRVVDLGSTNGTFLDGERVHAADLVDGSTITVGRTRIVVHTGAR